MKNIWSIFKTDIKNISKNPAAIIVIVALMFLPSLYAWLNIAASWDPYSNTRGVNVAVVSVDEGVTIEEKELNIGDTVISNLAKNDKLGWQFVTKDEAIKGVEHGDYYAAIIIPEDFSKNLSSVLSDDIEKPTLDYFINEKINAISPKVAGSGASAVVESIQVHFIEEVNGTILNAFNDLGISLEDNYDSIEKMRTAIFELEDELPEIEALMITADRDIDLAKDTVKRASASLDRMEVVQQDAQAANDRLAERMKQHQVNVDKVLAALQKDLKRTQQAVDGISNTTDRIRDRGTLLDDLTQRLQDHQDRLASSIDRLDAVIDWMYDTESSIHDTQIHQLDELIQRFENQQAMLTNTREQLEDRIFDLQNGKLTDPQSLAALATLVDAVDALSIELAETYAKTVPSSKELKELEATFTDVRQWAQEGQKVENKEQSIDALATATLKTRQDLVERLLRMERIALQVNKGQEESYPLQATKQKLAEVQRVLVGLAVIQKKGEQPQLVPPVPIPNLPELPSLGENLTLETLQKEMKRIEQSIAPEKGATAFPYHAFDRQIVKGNEQGMALSQSAQQAVEDAKERRVKNQQAFIEANENLANPERLVAVLQGVSERLQNQQQTITDRINRLKDLQQSIGDKQIVDQEVAKIRALQDKLREHIQSTQTLIQEVRQSKQNIGTTLDGVDIRAKELSNSIGNSIRYVNEDLTASFNRMFEQADATLERANEMIERVGETIPRLREVLTRVDESIDLGAEKLALVEEHYPEAKEATIDIANKIRQLEEQGNLDDLIDLLRNDPQRMSEFFASPVQLDEHKLFPIPNYGSGMNPFYTTLALWVGGLLLVSGLKVDIENKARYRSHEAYFSRWILFVLIGMMQAFIVTVGDIFIMKTFVVDKLMFVLFGMFISAAFITIVYTLVSIFGNTGKVLAIILLVMQIGGSGGTFPVQMAPDFFQKIHGFLPFTHGITLLREAVGGIIWPIVWQNMLYLFLYVLLSFVCGIALKQFFNKTSDRFMEKAKESKIVI